MNQADTIYEQELREQRVLDDEKSAEDLLVWAYPKSESGAELNVFILNLGPQSAKVVRVWINDHVFEENEVLTIINSNCTITYPVDVSELIFHVKVTTEKGNIFTNELGSLEYQFASSTWITPSLGICVNILNDKGIYRINVTEWSTGVLVGSYESQGTEFEDITQTFLVGAPTLYKIEVWKRVSGWKELPASPKKVPKKVEDWNKGPIKYVFINGMSI
jgi:hypothetical protein